MGWEVVQKIENPNGVSNDDFGTVSISGNYAVVGAQFEDSTANNAGAAYFYQRDSGGVWNLVKKFTGETDNDYFGESVSVSGNYAVVGAIGDGDGGSAAGAAYFYQKDSGGAWNQVKKFIGEAANDEFGKSVSISGNYAVVGAYLHDSTAHDEGAAYFYQKDSGGDWKLVKKFIGETRSDKFGVSVSISGNYAVVGASLDDDGNKGAAYFYQRDIDGNWNLVKKHTGEAAGDRFGGSVSISGNYAVLGAIGDDEAGGDAGAAYLYQRESDGVWNQVKKFTGKTTGDQFGFSVSISGNYAVVGAVADDDAGNNAGASYFYQRCSRCDWKLVKKFTGETAGDRFGGSVSISGNYSFCSSTDASTEYVKFIQYKV